MMDAVSDYLSMFQNAEKISRGMSGDEKYRVVMDGTPCLLRIAGGGEYERKKAEYEYLKSLNGAGLPVPECLDFCRSADGTKVFTLLSWLPGDLAADVLPGMSGREQYGLGFQAGDVLRRVHEHSPAADASGDWYDRYFAVMEPRLEAFRRYGDPFDGSEEVLNYLEENRALLKGRPMCRHHGDYHTENMVVCGGVLSVIDWHTVDFGNIGDPWYEFNRLGTEYPAFARGQIDGYFAYRVPETFWRLFALYLSVSALTSVVWAKYRAPEELASVMELNRRVAAMFGGMKDPVPDWYRKEETSGREDGAEPDPRAETERFVRSFIRRDRQERLLLELTHEDRRYGGLDRFCHQAEDLLEPRRIVMQGEDLDRSEGFRRFAAERGGPCLILSPDPWLDGERLPLAEAAERAAVGTDAAVILGSGYAVVFGESMKGGRGKYLLAEE